MDTKYNFKRSFFYETKNDYVSNEGYGIRRIPYYQFIYDNSIGKELVEGSK